ncbi:MAG: fluoride efflux transporter CrcB [Mycobacteriaceae bacterium]
MIALVVGLTGALGATVRFVLDGEIRRRRPSTFPFATAFINISGSFLLGVVAGLVLFHPLPDTLRLLVGVGFCGGYTTFSTANAETVRLAQQGRVLLAVANTLGPLVLSLLACGAGLLLTSAG